MVLVMVRTPLGFDYMTPQRDQYFKTLRFDRGTLRGEAQQKAALARAHELWTSETEHYWKRATQFWGFQVAIFAILGFLWADSSENPSQTEEDRCRLEGFSAAR